LHKKRRGLNVPAPFLRVAKLVSRQCYFCFSSFLLQFA